MEEYPPEITNELRLKRVFNSLVKCLRKFMLKIFKIKVIGHGKSNNTLNALYTYIHSMMIKSLHENLQDL